MQKTRIYELAKRLKVPNKTILSELLKLGVEGKTHSSSIEPDLVQKIEAALLKKPVKPSKETLPAKGPATAKPVAHSKEKHTGAHVKTEPPPEEKCLKKSSLRQKYRQSQRRFHLKMKKR